MASIEEELDAALLAVAILKAENDSLKAENARYREALDKAEKALKFYQREFD